jgi:hypothetical protein
MTLRILPDIYRLNAAQRDQLLDLYEAGLVKSPVSVAKRASGRVVARDASGNRWLIHKNGWADLIPDR